MDILDELSDKIWTTKKSRFAASSRMRNNHAVSSWSIAVSSIAVIVINMLVFLDAYKAKSEIISVLTICLSVTTLVISLMVERMDYSGRESNYHRCALDLDFLNQQIRLFKESSRSKSEEDVFRLQQCYKHILDSSNLNHTVLDYEWAMRNDNKSLKEHWIQKHWIILKWYIFRDASIYWLLMIAIVIITILMLNG